MANKIKLLSHFAAVLLSSFFLHFPFFFFVDASTQTCEEVRTTTKTRVCHGYDNVHEVPMITRSSSLAMDEENSTRMLLFPTSFPWNSISVFTKTAQEKGMDSETWGFHISSALGAAGVEMPSPELADVLVSHICWDNNVPAAWKYLNKAISCGIASSVLVIALLSTRVFLNRQKRPSAYRLYMEILKTHYFSLASQFNDSNSKRILILVDDILHLSKRFGVEACQPGVFNVVYIFYIIWQLVDAILEDEGLTDFSLGRLPRWINSPEDTEIDRIEHFNECRHEYNEKAFITNTALGIELIGQFLHHKVISRLLSLASQNMPHWKIFSKYLHLLASKSFALQSSTMLSPTFMHSSLDNLIKACRQYKPSQYSKFCAISSGSLASPGGHCQGFSCSAIWVPLDLYLEDAIDGSVAATNAIEIISGLLKALQAINRTSWHEAFLGLWIAALRLVQRERDPIEGPVPHEDTRMCILLSVTTLSIASVIKEDECFTNGHTEIDSTKQSNETSIEGTRRKALISSLQLLGDYKSLLVPPPSFISVASQAAAKAIAFVSGSSVPNGYCEGAGVINKFNCTGDMRHLIVEACIARNLLDTSAYYWPGYLFGPINQLPCSMSGQGLGWSELMMGAELTSSMRKALVNAPASSLVELEKVFEISVNGSSDDKISAAMILCGASLIRGWNIQEFTVRFVIKLLSPPVPTEYSGSESHLISHAPVLDCLLAGISSVDCVQVFSFHGLVPELAGALMVICEVFGSCIPNATWTLPTGEVSVHTVFSNAFILLLRLWEFNHTPLEYILMGDGAPVGSQLTPDYLLLLRNSQVLSSVDIIKNQNSDKSLSSDEDSVDLVFMDSFLKLKVWYRQHQACLASTLSGLIPGSPVYQNVNSLLNMMFKNLSKGTTQSLDFATSGSSSFSSSSINGSEDTTLIPRLPAWDIMEAVPYVVDAALTACAHGRLSPRALATGLKDLADFLPASLATIVSYFSAEVTRGVWRHANMNGTDWPSPAANLSTVGENIKKIVSATGADVPSLVEASQATLPLPLAAFVSHTITYKLDRDSERFLNLAGPALENLAASCPWPSMPIVAALWTQKVKRWSDFLTFSASRTIFHNNDSLVRLLRSCFSAVLGLNASPGSAGGVGSLLGHGFSSDHSGGLSPVAPGILYLRSYRSTRDAMFLTEEILSLLMLSVREVTSEGVSNETREKLTKSKYGTKYCQVSLSTAFTRVKTASSLGATLMWLSGGCGLIQCMFREILPSWFISFHHSKQGSQGDMVSMLEGYALAYFAMLSGMFGWGIDKVPLWRRRPKVIAVHLEFLTDVLDGKVSLGCSLETWRAYVSAFLGLMVECAPNWLLEMDLALLKRLSMGLRQWNEEDLALLLLERSGPRAMGAAAELIISSQ